MANITVLALDPQTGDLCFDANGMLMLREDAEAIAQNVNKSMTWKGEFPLNTDHGTDWERVVQQPRSEAVDEADSVVRSSIFQEPYVQEISSLSMTADGRALRCGIFGCPVQWRNNQSGGEHWWMNTDGA